MTPIRHRLLMLPTISVLALIVASLAACGGHEAARPAPGSPQNPLVAEPSAPEVAGAPREPSASSDHAKQAAAPVRSKGRWIGSAPVGVRRASRAPEPAPGRRRPPDRWSIELPATARQSDEPPRQPLQPMQSGHRQRGAPNRRRAHTGAGRSAPGADLHLPDADGQVAHRGRRADDELRKDQAADPKAAAGGSLRPCRILRNLRPADALRTALAGPSAEHLGALRGGQGLRAEGSASPLI